MTTVTLSSSVRQTVGPQLIYMRRYWQENWIAYTTLHCTEATWCLSPTMSTATLVYDYGWVKDEGDGVYWVHEKLDCLNWYVKIRLPCDAPTYEYVTWYGVVGHVEDVEHGIVTVGGTPAATGTQTLHCFGLKRILDTEIISESWADRGGQSPADVQLPITFNARGIQNRNDRLVPANSSYTFEGRELDPSSATRPTAQWWSTTDIVNYLLEWPTPRQNVDGLPVHYPPFALSDSGELLSSADRPVLAQEGQSVLSLLYRLIDRRRLRAFYLDVDETQSPDMVKLYPVALNSDLIDPNLDDADPLRPNPTTININYDGSQCSAAIVKKDKLTKYDQVIVRGARRTSTATLHVETGYLEPAWTATQETAYETAASNEANYSTWDWLEQIKRNSEVRGRDALSGVYSWFSMPDDWAGLVQEGDNAATHAVFVDADGVAVPQYIHEVFFEHYLPLWEHVDYSTVANATEPFVKSYRLPYIVFKTPTDARYVSGEAMATLAESTGDPDDANEDGDGINVRWSATARTHPDTRTVEINVSGEPQHVIAATDFTPLDEDRELGEFDYRSKGMLVTLCLRDNRSAEGRYPADIDVDIDGRDRVLRCVIQAGEAYRQDYLVPSTVVDVSSAGALVKSDGGYVRDDTSYLGLLARIAYEWWSQERIVIALTTADMRSIFKVGTMVEFVGDSGMPGNEHYEEVNTVISEVRISWPRLSEMDLQQPVMTVVTGAGELDPMTLVPPVPKQKVTGRLPRVQAAMGTVK